MAPEVVGSLARPGLPGPCAAGELRWYVRVQGETRWVAGPGRYEIDGETYTSRSRTFIPARLSDNPYLDRTGYRAGLENLPEPLRSQLLKGDFLAGREDDSWQVIPSDWIAQAQARWQPGIPRAMSSLGVDVAQGGADNSVLSPRHGVWFAPLRTFRGVETPDGQTLAAQIFVAMRDNCIVVVDCGGGHGGGAMTICGASWPRTRLSGLSVPRPARRGRRMGDSASETSGPRCGGNFARL